MPRRIQSPSSINTYKQCPRKYFYQYIMKLPTGENIHLIRGKIVHDVLENFYSIDNEKLTDDNYMEHMSMHIKNLFMAKWDSKVDRMKAVGLNDDQIAFYKEESTMMLANWITELFGRFEEERKKHPDETPAEVFKKIIPMSIEEEYRDNELGVRGFVDYIEKVDGKIKIMDYKTSKNAKMSPEYKLQLAIYSLLYKIKHDKMPDKVGIWFLKHGEMCISVDQELIDHAKFEIEQIHFATETSDIDEYRKKTSPLCKYSSGQCDFYDVCQGNISPEEALKGKK